MQQFHYLIIGGGMTADAAVKGIRSLDQENTIAIITNDDHPPYSRPPLTKALWKGEPEEKIWLKTQERKVNLILSREVKQIDTEKKTVTDETGDVYSFQKLLLATGGIVNQFPFQSEGIIYYRTYNDYKLLREKAVHGNHIMVIGGGFIGSEIAASLAMNDKKVTMIFPDTAIGSKNYPPALARFLNSYYKSKGVEVLSGEGVTDVKKIASGFLVKTKSGKELHSDVVVAGIGIKPNVFLAQQSGIVVGNGIEVNVTLQTNHRDIFAAGDVAVFFNPQLGRRIRVEHEDNALTMGELAGKNMTGASEKYQHLPFFYSDLFDLGYEAVGELDATHEMVEDWKEPYKEGVVYYLKENRVCGVLLWNTWGQVDHARELIGKPGPFDATDLKGLLPQ